MEVEDQEALKLKAKKNVKNYSIENNILDFEIPKKIIYYIASLFIFFVIAIYFYDSKINNEDKYLINQNINSVKLIRKIEDISEFDKLVLGKTIKEQYDFCDSIKNEKNLKREYEEQITLVNVSMLSQSFSMYVYKENDKISTELLDFQSWKTDETNNLLVALLFYRSIYSLKPHEIFVLDIGSSIGWHTLSFAKYGYNVLSFEPSEINNYILKKNFCINKSLNITLIQKGLYNTEGKCDYYVNEKNKGEGSVLYGNFEISNQNWKKNGEAYLTKLNNYISFLSSNNLGLVRIDTKGSEGKIIEGGTKLITKYRIPYIFLGFNPEGLRMHGTDPRKFLKIFLRNGYRFASLNFFDDEFLSIDEIMKKVNGTMNLYIVYNKMTRIYYNS